jgi:hypothetical protein
VKLRPLLVRAGLPPRAKRRLLDELELVTSRALGAEPALESAGSFDSRLRRYARATGAQARALEADDDPEKRAAALASLRAGSFKLGARARRLLGIRDRQLALETLCAFYHHIGIEACRTAPDELEVRRCRFAAEFDPPTCRLIGALDDGFAAGLAGGGRLVFTTRITEGAPCCRARLVPGGPR